MTQRLDQKTAITTIPDNFLLLATTATGSMRKITKPNMKKEMVGDISSLQTTNKDSIVSAINEVDNAVAGIQTDNVTLTIYKVSNFGTP